MVLRCFSFTSIRNLPSLSNRTRYFVHSTVVWMGFVIFHFPTRCRISPAACTFPTLPKSRQRRRKKNPSNDLPPKKTFLQPSTTKPCSRSLNVLVLLLLLLVVFLDCCYHHHQAAPYRARKVATCSSTICPRSLATAS